MPTDAIVVFSGGPDSTAAALWAVDNGFDVELMTFQFWNQRQYGEIRASFEVAQLLHHKHTLFDFKSPMQFFDGVSPLMHAGTSTGSPEASSRLLTFGAGMVLSAAIAYAVHQKKYVVVWGATKDDTFGGKFDYTQEFCDAFGVLVTKSIGRDFKIFAPLSSQHKNEIFSAFFQKKADLFARTWSCKMEVATQCGECHACMARRVAARLSKITDASRYQKNDIKWPLTDKQFEDLTLISEDVLMGILNTPKTIEFER